MRVVHKGYDLIFPIGIGNPKKDVVFLLTLFCIFTIQYNTYVPLWIWSCKRPPGRVKFGLAFVSGILSYFLIFLNINQEFHYGTFSPSCGTNKSIRKSN